MHCNLRPPDVAPVVLNRFLAKLVLRMRTKCYFAASDQDSDITIVFIHPDFLKESNNLAIGQRFDAVTLTFDHLTLKVCSTSAVTWSKSVSTVSEIEQSTAELLMI